LETIALRKEKEMLREHFAHIVSHELKAPLGAVQQNLFALEFELSDTLNEIQKEKVGRLKTRIEDMLKLINSWLRVISVDIDNLRENFTQISLLAPFSKALDSVESLAARKNIEIVTSIPNTLGPIQGDELSLSEAFVNLLANAIKYSHDGSGIVVQAEESHNEILISVKDAGIGISPEDLPHIFDGFYRGKDVQTTVTGHGIGLAVCRQIIAAHDGSIMVQSELGKGSTFVIRLPAIKQGSRPEFNLNPNMLETS
jgi:signal transduction histidine kinase